jgi:hypothetical protein
VQRRQRLTQRMEVAMHRLQQRLPPCTGN